MDIAEYAEKCVKEIGNYYRFESKIDKRGEETIDCLIEKYADNSLEVDEEVLAVKEELLKISEPDFKQMREKLKKSMDKEKKQQKYGFIKSVASRLGLYPKENPAEELENCLNGFISETEDKLKLDYKTESYHNIDIQSHKKTMGVAEKKDLSYDVAKSYASMIRSADEQIKKNQERLKAVKQMPVSKKTNEEQLELRRGIQKLKNDKMVFEYKLILFDSNYESFSKEYEALSHILFEIRSLKL